MADDTLGKGAQKEGEELEETELEKVAGGTDDRFNGKYVVSGVPHSCTGGTTTASHANKVAALVIKQKVVE